MKIIGTASVMRHGATRYTKVFPDLVEEGLPILRITAAEIVRRYPKPPLFVASPAERAVATATHVMVEYGLGWNPDAVQIDKGLSPINVSDHGPIAIHFARVAGHLTDPWEVHRAWDQCYMEHPDFEEGGFCEPRSLAKARFRQFLESLPALCGPDHHVVAVSHVELIGSVVRDWFGMKGGYFSPAEVVHLEYLASGQMQAEFRGEKKIVSL